MALTKVRDGAMPSGSVLQVVEAVSTGDLTLSNGADRTILTASITPSFTSSKVLILCSGQGIWQEPNTASNNIFTKIFRGTSSDTAIRVQKVYGYGTRNTAEDPLNFSINKLDSPSTTSSQTYTWTGSCSVHSLIFKTETAGQTILLMEIAG
tara:strand:+ start:34 stop:489 length:456 start_codon:yes stop_codon:yes gene_type:complete